MKGHAELLITTQAILEQIPNFLFVAWRISAKEHPGMPTAHLGLLEHVGYVFRLFQRVLKVCF